MSKKILLAKAPPKQWASSSFLLSFCPFYNQENNIKTLDFLDFKKAANLYKADKKNNTEQIKEIISNMNSKRKTNK